MADDEADTILSIDIGGTKMAAAIIGVDGQVHREGRAPTAGAGPEGLFGTLTALVDGVCSDWPADRLAGVGVGCGGPMTGDGRYVSPLNIPQWRGFDLRDRLTEHTRMATFVDNDAKALALGEGWMGAARGCRDYLAMVVSTGVGAGLVVDGRLLDGAAGNAGHLGHVIVDPLGRSCACGARGCLEAETSGTAISAFTGDVPAKAPRPVRVRTGRLVGRAIASAVSLLDLRLGVVAGSVALGYGDDFFDAANSELSRCARIEFARGARIVPSGCGSHGPLLGAAAVALVGLGRMPG